MHNFKDDDHLNNDSLDHLIFVAQLVDVLDDRV